MSRAGRGGRGGRGGGRGGMSAASRLNSGALPFEIDKELEDEFAKGQANSDSLFPVSAHTPPIITDLSLHGRAA